MSKNDYNTERLDREVQQTFESLDNIDDIEAGPHFFARLNARIEESAQAGDSWRMRLFVAGRLAPTLLIIAVLFNVITAVAILRGSSDNQVDLRENYVEVVADEYQLEGVSTWLEIASK